MSITKHNPAEVSLDERLYSLQGDELAFFQAQTGIQDEAELKKHIITIQEKAYDVKISKYSPSQYVVTFVFQQVFQYRCIRRFGFTQYVPEVLTLYSSLFLTNMLSID